MTRTEVRKARKPEEERLSIALRCYVTPGERDAVDILAAKYNGTSTVVRYAIANFISRHHPELKKFLRKDLDSGLGSP